MAWDDWQGDLVGPLRSSAVWKVTKPLLVKKQDDCRQIVIIDDYYQVCKAACEAGLWTILVETDYNHPAAPDIEIPYRKLPGEIYMHKSLPGMLRVANLTELPFALHIIQEQVLKGNRGSRWATGKHVAVSKQ